MREGLGWKAGWSWRELSQVYSYNQTRFNPNAPAPSLATTGVIPQNIDLYDGQGQTLLLVNPNGVRNLPDRQSRPPSPATPAIRSPTR